MIYIPLPYFVCGILILVFMALGLFYYVKVADTHPIATPIFHMLWITAFAAGAFSGLFTEKHIPTIILCLFGFIICIIILGGLIIDFYAKIQEMKPDRKKEAEKCRIKCKEADEVKWRYLEKERTLKYEIKRERDEIITAAKREAEEIIDRAQTETARQKEDAKQEAAKTIERAEAEAREKVKNIFALNKKVGDKADPIRAALYEEYPKHAEHLLQKIDPSRIRNAATTDLKIECLDIVANVFSTDSTIISEPHDFHATIRSGKELYDVYMHRQCSCKDFKFNTDKCKHMIFLAHAVGVFETIPEEAFEEALEEKGETK